MAKVTFNSQDKLNDNYQFQGQNDFFGQHYSLPTFNYIFGVR